MSIVITYPDAIWTAPLTAVVDFPPLWMVRESAFAGTPPAPGVVPLLDQATQLTKQWQFYSRAINYNMTPEKVSALLGYQKAFTNNSGFGQPGAPRADYILGENLTEELPRFDKVRSCVRTTHAGDVYGDKVLLETMDGSRDPALKPGCIYPNTLADVDINAYVHAPETHPHLFVVANIVDDDGTIDPFPNGALYPWTLENRPYTFLPLVSRYDIYVPLAMLAPVTEVQSPYK